MMNQTMTTATYVNVKSFEDSAFRLIADYKRMRDDYERKLAEKDEEISKKDEANALLMARIERLEQKNRTDYGVRSFEDHNGKRWYLLSDLAVSAGFKSNALVYVVKNRVKYGSVRMFTYREMVGKVECPPRGGVKCVDEKGREEFLGKPLIPTGKGHSLNTMKVAKIRELRSAGVDFEQIAKEVGCSVSTACKYAIA